MLIKRTKGWELPEREATSESLYLNRRTLVKAMGLGAHRARRTRPRPRRGRSSAGKYPGQAPRQVRQSRAGHGREARDDLQQLSTNSTPTRASGGPPRSCRSVPGRSR